VIKSYSLATIACSFAFGGFVFPAAGQNPPAAGDAPSHWALGAFGVGRGADGKSSKTAAPKGLAITLGEHGDAAVAYDLDLCRIVGAWTGKFTSPAEALSRGDHPAAIGEVAFTTSEIAGVISGPAKEPWHDDRPAPTGPLPAGQAQFKGFFVRGDKTILKWDLSGTEVLEMPGHEVVMNGGGYFTRTFCVAPCMVPTQLLVAADLQPGGPIDVLTHLKSEGEVPGLEDKERIMQSTPWAHGEKGEVMIWAAGDPDGSTWRLVNDQLTLEVPQHAKPVTFQIAYWIAPKSDPDGKTAPLFFREPQLDLHALTNGLTLQMPEPSGNASAAK